MLAQKLSRITLKMSDLQEYEEMKRKKREAAKQSKGGSVLEQKAVHRIMNESLAKRSPRKALTFGVTSASPARTSTPDDD